MQKKFFFLGGLPRSGSTLLGSILNQNPDVYVSPTSPLHNLYYLTDKDLKDFHQRYTFDLDQVSKNLQNNLHHTYYQHISKPYIIDKNRAWTRNIAEIKTFIDPDPRLICTYRPTAEVITSFIRLAREDPDNVLDRDLRSANLDITDRNRAIVLWNKYNHITHDYLRHGLADYPETILIVRYDDLVRDAQAQIDRVYDFLNIPRFQHTLAGITNACPEDKDTALGYRGLHDIRGEISKTSLDPATVLDSDLLEFFQEKDQELALDQR